MKEKDKMNRKESENSLYPKIYCAKLPTISLVYKARSFWKLSHKNLLRDNATRSCHWEVFPIRGVRFFPGEGIFIARKIDLKNNSSFQRFSNM